MSVVEIKDLRTQIGSSQYLPRQAYIFNSLKHPDEIDTLRKIYGKSEFIFSVYSGK